jgi:hypothetical protein
MLWADLDTPASSNTVQALTGTTTTTLLVAVLLSSLSPTSVSEKCTREAIMASAEGTMATSTTNVRTVAGKGGMEVSVDFFYPTWLCTVKCSLCAVDTMAL